MKRRLYYAHRDAYWSEVESTRPVFPNLIGWSFDFISIHYREEQGYSLLSPSFLCDRKRPHFEKKRFKTLQDAKKYAVRLCRAIGKRWRQCHIVNCC